MWGTYVASFVSFVSISTKNEWNEENAGGGGGGGGWVENLWGFKTFFLEHWGQDQLLKSNTCTYEFSSVLFTFTCIGSVKLLRYHTNCSQLQYNNLAKVNYNARIHMRIVSWHGSPEETRRLMKPGLPITKK